MIVLGTQGIVAVLLWVSVFLECWHFLKHRDSSLRLSFRYFISVTGGCFLPFLWGLITVVLKVTSYGSDLHLVFLPDLAVAEIPI